MTQLPAHVQEHIDSIKTVDYFSGRGPLPEGCKVYETRAAAADAARAAAEDAARDAAWAAAADAAQAAALAAALDAAWDAALLAVCLLMRDRIDPKHLEYARLRWSIWPAGYGVVAKVGVHYCYKRP